MTANRIIGIGGATVIVLLISFTWWNRSKDAPSRKSIQPSRGAEQVLATASAPVHKRSGKPTGTTEDNRPGKAAFIGAATLQAPPTANPPFSVRIEGTRPNARQVDQLARSVDAGDSYPTPNGLRKLYRLQGGVVVQIAEGADEQTTVDQLTAPGAALDGCEIEAELDPRLVVLRRADTDEVRKADPSPANTDEQRLTSARAAVGVASANPLFVEPESGLLLVPTSEVLLRLKAGVDPLSFFGPDWAKVRAVGGTDNQFVLAKAGLTAEEVLAEVKRRAADTRVVWAEPNFRSQIAQQVVGQPNDPLLPFQWHLQNRGQGGGKPGADIKAMPAWQTTTGSETIIAILDDGTETTHPDLKGNLAINTAEVPDDGIDEDGNGYIDDVSGWDFYSNYSPGSGSNDPNPKTQYDNHGTAVAGVAVAQGGNGAGVAGAAYSSRLLPVRVLKTTDELGNGWTQGPTAIAEAVYYAAGRTKDGSGKWRGADVINLSFAMPQSQAVDEALAWAARHGRNGKGCPIFAATGNNASGWSRHQVPYKFIPGQFYKLQWVFLKDATTSEGDDTAWLDSIVLPDGTSERFEGGNLEARWRTGGDAPWTVVQDGVNGDHALTGWDGPGSKAVRAGRIGDSQYSFLEVTCVATTNTMSFWSWVSSELNYDGLAFLVNGQVIGVISGVPLTFSDVSYPASHPDTIAVGASTDFDFRADYSQYGDSLDFLAPSGGGSAPIYTTDRIGTNGYNTNADYCGFSGTSAACPLAAAVGALVLSANPDLTASEVRTLMRQTCDKVGGVNYHNGRNLYTGFGRINAEKAVLAARTPGPSVPDGTLVAALAQGRQRLTLHGQPGQTYRIESSDNLVDWAGIRTVILISNEFTLEPYLSPDFQHRFYRAVLQSEGIADGK